MMALLGEGLNAYYPTRASPHQTVRKFIAPRCANGYIWYPRCIDRYVANRTQCGVTHDNSDLGKLTSTTVRFFERDVEYLEKLQDKLGLGGFR